MKGDKIKLLEENKEYIINQYRKNIKINELAIKFNCSFSYICTFIQKNALLRKKIGKIYTIDENYFQNIDNEHKAYWAGFLFADGCIIIQGKHKYLALQLHSKDIDRLEQFKIDTNSNHKIYTKIKHRSAVELRFTNNKLCDDLIKLGCTPKKTCTIEFPNLQEDLVRHFMRGFFDGDGCVYKSQNLTRCKIVGTEKFLIGLQKELLKIGINKSPYFHPSNKIHNITIHSKKDVKNFFDWMYKDSTIYMERKYKIFKNGRYE